MLAEMAQQENALFFSLIETRMRNDHLNSELYIKDYTTFRADRSSSSHGGVATYIRDDIASSTEELKLFSNGTTELLSLYLRKIGLILITVYRPPNTTMEEFINISKMIKEIISNVESSTEVIILGDFNLPSIKWSNMSIKGTTREGKQQALALIEVMENDLLIQCIDMPTRGDNILDLIIMNSNGLIHSLEATDTVMSDHKFITALANIGSLSISNNCPNNMYTRILSWISTSMVKT
ncbi:hypothetical protein E2C01_027628 [Portunus trituberculatus]|uniref:Endonuclease/exonuclease/phosphatase domain-containing protein n=1 Tax=Portunus trituberculatus TaxID=210409 RepID=A0A5B7EP79_PORTR|nr:hypothetical protein [Portunus trituberculatus]